MISGKTERFDKLGMLRLIVYRIQHALSFVQIGRDNIARWIAKGADQLHWQWEKWISVGCNLAGSCGGLIQSPLRF